ncbi:MAG: MFS transporter [Candidatus Protochlamydia sp.]|nr:MFS transporter [Candidatus Protochlamydia sp.]
MKKGENIQNKSNLSFLIILLIGFVDYLGIGLVYPIFAVLLFDSTHPIVPFDSSPEYRGAILGLLIALTPLSQFFCSPILGAFSDLKGRRIALIIGISAGCLGYALAIAGIYMNSLGLLFLYRILVGASDATAAVAQATLADISTEENKAKRFAFLNSSFGFGFTVGPFLGGIIADSSIVSWFNYSTPLMAAGLMSLTNLCLVLWRFPETKMKVKDIQFDFIEGIRNLRRVFMAKHLKWLFLAGFALAFGWAFFNEFVPLLLSERFSFTLSQIGEYYAFTGACYALGALLATRFVHQFTPEIVAITSLVIAAGCMFLFGLVEHSYYIWWLIPIMMGCLAFAYPTAVTIVSNKASSESQGEVLGVYHSVGAAAMGLSPLLVGSAIGVYPGLTAWGGAFCLVLSSLGFWMGRRQNKFLISEKLVSSLEKNQAV